MLRRRSNPLIRVGLAVVAIGLLSAFTYPLMQEGYERVSVSAFQRAQQQLLTQSLADYLRFNSAPGWTVNTPTREILKTLAVGLDRSMSGKPDSFLPASVSLEELDRDYRILYRNPQSFKVLPR